MQVLEGAGISAVHQKRERQRKWVWKRKDRPDKQRFNCLKNLPLVCWSLACICVLPLLGILEPSALTESPQERPSVDYPSTSCHFFLALQPSPSYAEVQSPYSFSPMPISCDPQPGSRSEWFSSLLLTVTWAYTRARTMGQISSSWLFLYPVPGYPQGLELEGLQIKCIGNNYRNPIYFP